MKQCFLKSLDVSTPQIALGTVELGLPYGFGLDGVTSQPTFEQAARLVHAALDRGIRFIDTARAYGDSEDILGRCLEGRRSEVLLATKAGPLHLDGCTDAEVASSITASVEQSLRSLRTDTVDWLMLHSMGLDQLRQLPRFLEPLEKLRQQGKFRALGASIYDDALGASVETPEFACLQIAASVIDRRAERALSNKPADGKDFIFRSVLLRGALTGRYHSMPASMEPLQSAIAHLEQLATDAGLSLTELAYRYAADFDGLVLVGTASISELEQAVAFVERGPLSEDVKEAVRSMGCLEDRFLNPGQWPAIETQATGTAAGGARQ
jgi:aryl-alcohol dehydrogenase-like predicted oxidoreductase